jgi:SAM-dependent methyltransferase
MLAFAHGFGGAGPRAPTASAWHASRLGIDLADPNVYAKLHAVVLRRLIEHTANGVLSPLGVRIVRRGRAPTIGGRRLSDEHVIADAQQRGISPGVLLEELFHKPGRARDIVARMAAAGVFAAPVRTVVEIGAGSGIYVEELLKRATVERYEVYELEENRARYLAGALPVLAQRTDGETLQPTASRSADLVHAHGVFVTLDFLTSCSYFREIVRVLAPGGHVIFDIIDERSLDEDAIESWLASRLRYPSMLPLGYVTGFFERHGFVLIDEFSMPLLVHGRSHYLIFRQTGEAPARG